VALTAVILVGIHLDPRAGQQPRCLAHADKTDAQCQRGGPAEQEAAGLDAEDSGDVLVTPGLDEPGHDGGEGVRIGEHRPDVGVARAPPEVLEQGRSRRGRHQPVLPDHSHG
jgi:hypothetical protein